MIQVHSLIDNVYIYTNKNSAESYLLPSGVEAVHAIRAEYGVKQELELNSTVFTLNEHNLTHCWC